MKSQFWPGVDTLYGIRRVARTRAGLLTEKQQHRLAKVLTDQRHVAFATTWSVYQDVIDAFQADQPSEGKRIMTRLITKLHSGVPAGLDELRTLGQTLKRRRDDILAFFDHPGTSNGPTEALKCRHRHLMAYADVWIMPTVTTSALVGTGWVGGLSA